MEGLCLLCIFEKSKYQCSSWGKEAHQVVCFFTACVLGQNGKCLTPKNGLQPEEHAGCVSASAIITRSTYKSEEVNLGQPLNFQHGYAGVVSIIPRIIGSLGKKKDRLGIRRRLRRNPISKKFANFPNICSFIIRRNRI